MDKNTAIEGKLDTLTTLVEKGFSAVAETALSIRMEYASFDDYWAPYAGKDGPGAEYVTTLGAAERARLRAAVKGIAPGRLSRPIKKLPSPLREPAPTTLRCSAGERSGVG